MLIFFITHYIYYWLILLWFITHIPYHLPYFMFLILIRHNALADIDAFIGWSFAQLDYDDWQCKHYDERPATDYSPKRAPGYIYVDS